MFPALAKEFDRPEPLATAHYQMRQAALDTLRKAGPDELISCYLETADVWHPNLRSLDVHDRRRSIRNDRKYERRAAKPYDGRWVEYVDCGRRSRGWCDWRGRSARLLACQGPPPAGWGRALENVQPNSLLNDPIAAKSQWSRQGKGSKKVHHAVYNSGTRPPTSITLSDWYRVLKVLRDIARETQPWPNAAPEKAALIDDAVTFLDKIGERAELEHRPVRPGARTPVVGTRCGGLSIVCWSSSSTGS